MIAQKNLPTSGSGRYRVRPYVLAQLNARTPAAVIRTMYPPAPSAAGRHRGFGPWAKHPGHATPAATVPVAPAVPTNDVAELGALTRQLLAQRPDLAHPHPLGIGARTGVALR